MAVFDSSTLNDENLVWQLMRHGPITLFYKTEILDETTEQLKQKEYSVHQFSCENYDKGTILNDICLSLGVLPDWGQKIGAKPNLDSFNDFLRDIKVPDESGTVIVLRGYDSFYQRFPCAHAILDISNPSELV